MLNLVPISPEHQNILTTWFADDSAGNKELASYKDIFTWLKLLNSIRRWGWIAYQEKNEIGFVDLEKDVSNVGHFSFYIAPEERGRGKSKELLLALIQKVKNLNIHLLQAAVEQDNISSQKALESFGFIYTGRDKDNSRIYQLEINNQLDPRAPK